MIPIVLKRTGTAVPVTSHYVVAQNGLFLHKKMPWADAIVPIMPSTLESLAPSVTLLLPALSAMVMYRMLRLAKVIYDRSKSEVCALIHYSAESGYELTVPAQEVNPVHIDYDARQRIPKAACVGTIHSHGELPAFHSETDCFDEGDFDGVHITIGSVNRYPKFSLSANVVVNEYRFEVDPSWFEGITKTNELCELTGISDDGWLPSSEWLSIVKEKHLKKAK